MTDATSDVHVSTATAKAIIRQAERLGLTWTIRIATVETGSPLTAIFDGDTVPISMISVIGQLGPGNRVYVMAVPPAANFVIGYVTSASAAFGTVYSESFTGNPLVATTSGAEAVIATSLGAVEFSAQRAYLIKARVRVDSAIAQGYAFRVRVDTIGGSLVLLDPGDTRVGTGNFTWIYTEVPLLIGAASTFRFIVFTGAGGTGANPVNWRGGTGSECYLMVEDIGPTELFQGIFATL